jgi:nucleoside-diphosphate-sugar epimerase
VKLQSLNTVKSMEKVVVTGATSMLGLALIEECLRNDTQAIAIIRKNSKKTHILPESPLVRVFECDLNGLGEFELGGQGRIDAFYHFAWEATCGESRDSVSSHVRNIGYTMDALSLAKRLGARRFIGAGSQAEYGRRDHAISPSEKVDPENAYGVSKYAAGRLASIRAAQLGLEFIWARVFSAYGRHDNPNSLIMYCIDCLLKGVEPILTCCGQLWDYIHCSDAARAFYLIGGKGVDQSVYNIGSGEAKPLCEYVYTIQETIGAGISVGIGKKEYPPKQVMHLCADIESLRKDTGFEARMMFEEGIRDTVKWYASH